MFTRPIDGGDKFKDFNRTQGDKIQLKSTNFGTLAKGGVSDTNFVANSTGQAVDADDYFVFDTSGNALYYDADASGSGVPVLLVTLTNSRHLKASDLVLI